MALGTGLGAFAGTLAACGGYDDGGGGGDAGTGSGDGGRGGSCTPETPTISSNHGHTLSVPAADVEAGTEQTYDIRGSSSHSHTVTITAADFTELRDSGSIRLTSSTDAGHNHVVTITCA